jgi:hypothetical protein
MGGASIISMHHISAPHAAPLRTPLIAASLNLCCWQVPDATCDACAKAAQYGVKLRKTWPCGTMPGLRCCNLVRFLADAVSKPDDCEVGAGRKACANCSCGRAKAEAAGVKVELTQEMLDNPQSACGNVRPSFPA